MVRPSNLENKRFTGLRDRVAAFIENPLFSRFIIAVILVNAVTLGLETSDRAMETAGETLVALDRAALTIFVGEILLKLFVYRLSFFRAGWNVFDFVIVGIALIPAVGPLSVLRALRVLRILRLVSIVPQMRRVVAALFHAIPGMASIIAVMLVIFYVAAVLTTKLFGAEFEELFGDIGNSMFTLFQVMTLEGWPGDVARPVMEVYPLAWLFFVPFIVITTFAVLNLFIGIIVDAMNFVHGGDEESGDRAMQREIHLLRDEIRELRRLMESKKS